jgi:hypothetical protein
MVGVGVVVMETNPLRGGDNSKDSTASGTCKLLTRLATGRLGTIGTRRNAKLVGQLAKPLPELDLEQIRLVWAHVEIEVEKWRLERQSAINLLRELLTAFDEMRLDVRLAAHLAQAFQKVEARSDEAPDIVAAIEALRVEVRELRELVTAEGR